MINNLSNMRRTSERSVKLVFTSCRATSTFVKAPETLATVLRPFVSLLEPHYAGKADDMIVFATDNGSITFGDLRRARDVLQELEQ